MFSLTTSWYIFNRLCIWKFHFFFAIAE